jgi:hypothetical protein
MPQTTTTTTATTTTTTTKLTLQNKPICAMGLHAALFYEVLIED